MATALAAAAVAATPAGAAAPDDYAAVAARMAAPWPARQDAGGSFREYVIGHNPRARDDYGEAMLGYGLLQVGLRDGDDVLVRAGLRGVTHDAALPDASGSVRVFRNMAIAAAYNLARERLAEHPDFARVRSVWEQRLKHVRIGRLDPRKQVTNKTLVEAVEVLELARSGLASGDPAAVVHRPERYVRIVERLLSGRLPHATTPARRAEAPAAALSLVGDAPDFPPAYHALSAGFLARAVDLLGPRAPAQGRALLQRSAGASWALAGPDGDLAYTGRSQEQIWALAMTAYAAESVRPASSPPAAAALGALADRAIGRLERDHVGGPAGFAITPALARDVRGGSRGVDDYATGVQYTGLALVALNWAHDAARPEAASGDIGADRDGSFVLGHGRARFATVRAGDVWFAVRQAPGTEGDLRYDFGLVALKARGADGSWHDVLPVRPLSTVREDSAGPVLLSRGRTARPEGRRLVVDEGGDVTVTGGFRSAGGGWLRRGVEFRFRVLPCGVRLELPTRAGDSYEYSAFVRGSPSPAAAGDGAQQLAFDPRPSASRAGRFSSGTDPWLTRVRLRFASKVSGALALTTCTRP